MSPAADPNLYAPYTVVWTALLFAGFQTVVTTAILYKIAFRDAVKVAPVLAPAPAPAPVTEQKKDEAETQHRCSRPGCGGKLGDVAGGFATDAGSFEERRCLTCKQVHLLKRHDT